MYNPTNISSLTRCLVHYSYNMRNKNDLEIPHFRLGKKKDEDTHGEGDGPSGYEYVQRLTGEYTKAVTRQI